MVTPDFPKLRQDLIFAPCLDGDGKTIVKDPILMRYFRINQHLVEIMQSLDGTRSIDQLAHAYDIQPDTMSQLVADMRGRALLESDRDPHQLRRDNRQRQRETVSFWERLFFIRIGVFDPYPLASKLYDVFGLRLLFSWIGFCATLVLFTVALLVGYVNQTMLWETLDSLYSPYGFLLGLMVYLGTSFLHELGHVWACKRFGGQASEMGVGLYFLSPFFFVDISDAWFFPRKTQRLIAHAAGVLTDFFVASLAILVLYFFNVPGLRDIATLIIITNTFHTVNNLNPLLRLDGYFLLSDWLNVTNLRSKGFGLIFAAVRGIAYRLKLTADAPFQLKWSDRRERAIAISYGVLSVVYLMIVIVLLVQALDDWLVGIMGHQAAALVSHGVGLIFFVAFLNLGWKRSTSRKSILLEY